MAKTPYVDNNGLLFIFNKIKATFQQKEASKGLSTNDYTDAEKNKLAGIESGAQVNPTKLSELENDKGFVTAADIPDGAAASTTTPKMDGVAAVGSESGFARGDHVHPTDTSRAPASLRINGHSLTEDFSLTSADVGAIPTTQKGQANGVASLGADGKVLSEQLPSYVDDVIEGYYSDGQFYEDGEHATLIAGEKGKIYLDLTTNTSYRFGGTAYTQIVSSDMVPLTNQEITDIFNQSLAAT